MKKKYKAAVLGYYGFGNLGDELLLEACLEMFERCGVRREEVIVLTNAPEECDGPAVNRWRLREVVRALRESESLVLGGGGLFQDSTSVKSCVWYWGMVRLAKILGCKVWAIGQSVGPLRSVVGRIVAGDALRKCEVVHVRDEGSSERAMELGCERVILGTDLVMTLRVSDGAGVCTRDSCAEGAELRAVREAEVVYPDESATPTAATAPTHPPAAAASSLVNLRPSPLLEHFIQIIAPLINSHSIGAALSDEDIPPLQKLGLSHIVRVKNLHDALALWSAASCTIGMRLHFGVLSRIFRKPLALLPYDPKISAFAQQSGVPCITEHWLEPVIPLPIPANTTDEIDALCREILAL